MLMAISSVGVGRKWGSVGNSGKSMATLRTKPMGWPDSSLTRHRNALYVTYLKALWNKLDASYAEEQSSTVGCQLIELIRSFHTPPLTHDCSTSHVTHTEGMRGYPMPKYYAGPKTSTSASSGAAISSPLTPPGSDD